MGVGHALHPQTGSLNTSLVANMVSVCAREEVTTRDMVVLLGMCT